MSLKVVKALSNESIADYIADAMRFVSTGDAALIQSDIGACKGNKAGTKFRKPQRVRRLLSLAMQLSLDGIIIGDSNGNILYVNKAILDLFNGVKEDFIGKNVLAFVAKRDKERAFKLSLNAMRTGAGYVGEFTALRKDAAEVAVEVTATVVKDNGQAIGFIDIVRDITERKTAETSLKKQAALIDLSPSAIIIKNSEEIITFWSLGAEKLYGYSKEEALGKKIVDLLKSKHNKPMNEILTELRQGKHWIEEVTHYTKDDREIVVQTDWLAILDNNRKVTEILESNVDITAHRRAEEETLRKAEERYLKAERLAAIGQLAGMVGHDLRNPLAGIKNAVYVLRKKQGSFIGESGNDMLNVIDQAVEHADSIILDLLDYSREIHLQVEEYSSKSLINYSVLSLKVPNNIKIIEKTRNQQVCVDANKMQRVFVNLIKNSFDAMPMGGQLEISSRQDKATFSFIFADAGRGMPEDVIAKIFTPLFTTKAQGMGLGLAICKRFVEAHNGKISVQSIVDKGTTFTVTLPIQLNR
jgi:two-component system, cell cycle sensor histidine kinase and response regulator CckA